MHRSTTSAPSARASVPAAVVLALLAGGCLSADSGYEGEDPYRNAVREGRLEDARALVEERLRVDPDDARAQRRLLDVEVMRHLEEARTLTFDDKPQAALDVLLEAQRIDPENPTVQVWIAKTRRQLADEWLDIASAFSGDANLAQAEYALRRALLYVPDDPNAKQDLERILIRAAYREDVSRDYFYEGLRKLREARLESADRDLGIATLYDEANVDAARRREDVRERLARETLASARGLEADGLHFAAFNEYRAVLFHDPDQTEALEGVERLRREVKAEQHLRHAEMMVRRHEFTEAADELAQARELTTTMLPRIERLEGEIEAERWETLYEKALALYADRRYEEAVEVLDRLIEEAGDYEDARDQRKALLGSIAKAETLYARALETEDLSERLALFEQIHEIEYPEYRDVRERIAELRAELAPEGA